MSSDTPRRDREQTSLALDGRLREVLRCLWREGPLSRWELHEKTGAHPNAMGAAAGTLLRMGLLREGSPAPSAGGRPRLPLEIDATRRHVVGLAISPGRVETGKLNLLGQLIPEPTSASIRKQQQSIEVAAEMLKQTIDSQTLVVGLSVTGFVDIDTHSLLLSAIVSQEPRLKQAVSLQPLWDAANGIPIVLENDMHAASVRWSLTHKVDQREDVLLVTLSDGRVGASMLINGRPNRGCAVAANEMGHMRFPVATEPCYCGQTGCLERICSTDFLRRNGAPADVSLVQAAERYNGGPGHTEILLGHLSNGLANVVNFVRPNRLVLAGDLMRYDTFVESLINRTTGLLLPDLADRTRFDRWQRADTTSAETAGWLGLASIYYDEWAYAAEASYEIQTNADNGHAS